MCDAQNVAQVRSHCCSVHAQRSRRHTDAINTVIEEHRCNLIIRQRGTVVRISPYFEEIKARALQLLTSFQPTATTVLRTKGEIRQAVRDALSQARDEMYTRERPTTIASRAERAAVYRRINFNVTNFTRAERELRNLIWTRLYDDSGAFVCPELNRTATTQAKANAAVDGHSDLLLKAPAGIA
ncbi:hypothetical protein ACFIOY_20080 [Bradyrhizobium sp. TZ2]